MKPSNSDRHDALPAQRAAGLHSDAENLRIEQPRRPACARAARSRMARALARRRDHAQTIAAISAISKKMPAIARPAVDAPNCSVSQS
jgi:hypothetical protein